MSTPGHFPWIPVLVLIVGVIALGWSIFVTWANLQISKDILGNATRPSFLIMEIEAFTPFGRFDDDRRLYFIEGPPKDALHGVRVNIWNTGERAAENVTVGWKFSSNATDIDIWNTGSITKCRTNVCSDSKDQSNEITIRAIEAGGFSFVNGTYTIQRENLEKLNKPVIFTIFVENRSTGQTLEACYTLYATSATTGFKPSQACPATH